MCTAFLVLLDIVDRISAEFLPICFRPAPPPSAFLPLPIQPSLPSLCLVLQTWYWGPFS